MTKRCNNILSRPNFSTWNTRIASLVQKLFIRGLREIAQIAVEEHCEINWCAEDDDYIIVHLPLGVSDMEMVSWKINIKDELVRYELYSYAHPDGTFPKKDAERFAKLAAKFRGFAEMFEEASKKVA